MGFNGAICGCKSATVHTNSRCYKNQGKMECAWLGGQKSLTRMCGQAEIDWITR
ncbi:hypothetical protein [Rubritalea tangerina]|uniref:hypothetical protein n=1 Tax=Rubritalea tangerina TaxID=430798 RepID=UPI003605CDDE